MTRRPWDHGKTAEQRGYGREHRRIRDELAKGGTGDRSNYQWLCKGCADEKDARDRGVRVGPRIGLSGWPE